MQTLKYKYVFPQAHWLYGRRLYKNDFDVFFSQKDLKSYDKNTTKVRL